MFFRTTMDSNKFRTNVKMDDKLLLALKYVGEEEISLLKRDVHDKKSTKRKGERTETDNLSSIFFVCPKFIGIHSSYKKKSFST